GYAERSSLSDVFATFVALPVEALANRSFNDANLSDGCDRLYLMQTSGVFFTVRE
ncbi:MAG: hypothetical protein H0V17_36445, partial [Deltaproteobacteria bacterium]|nr:hypothetical protein [Deltaproteobacteria bacterium]